MQGAGRQITAVAMNKYNISTLNFAREKAYRLTGKASIFRIQPRVAL